VRGTETERGLTERGMREKGREREGRDMQTERQRERMRAIGE